MEHKLIEMKAVIAAGMMAIGAVLGWKGIMVLTWVFLLALDYLTGSFAAMKAGSGAARRHGRASGIKPVPWWLSLWRLSRMGSCW